MLRSSAGPLLPLVQLNSERTLESTRRNSSFAEKQQPQPELLHVVSSSREPNVVADFRFD